MYDFDYPIALSLKKIVQNTRLSDNRRERKYILKFIPVFHLPFFVVSCFFQKKINTNKKVFIYDKF